MVLSPGEWAPVREALNLKHKSPPPKLSERQLEAHLDNLKDFIEVLEKRKRGDTNYAKQANDLAHLAGNMAEFAHVVYKILKTRPSWEVIDASLAVL